MAAEALLGNGWVWLVEEPNSQRLRIFTSTVCQMRTRVEVVAVGIPLLLPLP